MDKFFCTKTRNRKLLCALFIIFIPDGINITCLEFLVLEIGLDSFQVSLDLQLVQVFKHENPSLEILVEPFPSLEVRILGIKRVSEMFASVSRVQEGASSLYAKQLAAIFDPLVGDELYLRVAQIQSCSHVTSEVSSVRHECTHFGHFPGSHKHRRLNATHPLVTWCVIFVTHLKSNESNTKFSYDSFI